MVKRFCETVKVIYDQIKIEITKTTMETFDKTDKNEEIVVCKNAKEMFDNLEI